MLPLPDSSTGLDPKAGALPPTVHLIARGAPGDEPKLKSALESALRELGVECFA